MLGRKVAHLVHHGTQTHPPFNFRSWGILHPHPPSLSDYVDIADEMDSRTSNASCLCRVLEFGTYDIAVSWTPPRGIL